MAAAGSVHGHAARGLLDCGPDMCYAAQPAKVHCAGPTNFGPTAEAGTPWLQLALYTAMQQGPLTVVLVCGQRLWRLPPQLASCTHALVWPWDLESVRAQTSPVLLEGAFLLFSLNEYLSRTAVMVQPLNLAEGAEMSNLRAVQIPLPPAGKSHLLEGGDACMAVCWCGCGMAHCRQADCLHSSIANFANAKPLLSTTLWPSSPETPATLLNIQHKL